MPAPRFHAVLRLGARPYCPNRCGRHLIDWSRDHRDTRICPDCGHLWDVARIGPPVPEPHPGYAMERLAWYVLERIT